MIEISKELLSGAMGVKKEDIIDLRIFGEELRYYEKCLIGFDCNCRISKRKDSICKCINIYELAHRCKEWAFKNGFEIVVMAYSIRIYRNGFEVYSTNTTLFDLDMFFKACEWILGKIKEGN